jgi:beta-phosphoglucomutase-like phosphatase (HAD superfamily)
MQMQKCGLMPYFAGRIFSGHDLPRSKPAPDVYLVAARAVNVAPHRCLVIEDTVTGVTSGVAAGATVWGYSPPEAGHDAPEALRKAGASAIFTRMADLPGLVA